MSNERKRLENEMLKMLAKVFTQEQMIKSREYFAKLSFQELMDLYSSMVAYGNAHTPDNMSTKTYMEMVRKIRSKNGDAADSKALLELPTEFMEEREAEAIWNSIDASCPSDHIYLTHKEDEEIIRLWAKEDKAVEVPSDIFFVDTIPLLDVRITIDETDEPDGKLMDFRIVIFDDFKKRIEEGGEHPITVGAVLFGSDLEYKIFTPIIVAKGYDSIITGLPGCRGWSKEKMNYYCEKVPMYYLNRSAGAILSTWYGIQIALLHPTVRTVFRGGRKSRDEETKLDRKPGTKRVVRYVKKHIIKHEEMEECLYGGESNINRHTLVWYVIGHWRKLANGTKQFIKPYWKGPLRELKMALDDREREIVTGGTANA
ncbi:hypothetical protein ACTGZ3_11015 [Clostridioides difficile]|uniref:hypothetical protein n=1 Tax=Clostridioides difficile TaxID=1496 RepID=UPI0021C6EC9E|nr:hypothetical protein [Clostridioides difficile]UUV09521.1 hypothetical protein NQ182_14475 [Clostridioides difficile]HCU2976164.1 hypothetical protein [Clostridioides difficile]HCU3024561.1 hypothetical protein [Clostridioides difficile]HCU3028382.1 hypothetical protein [Clostridioides difficile]